jgi:hypothetical protein
MPPPRRRPRQNKASNASSRVRKVDSPEKWEEILDKAVTKGRLVFTLFYQSAGASTFVSSSLRGLFAKVSTQPKYLGRIVFTEADADTADWLSRKANIKRCPVVQAWWQREPVDSWACAATLDAPAQLNQFLQRNMAEYLPSQGPMAKILKIAAAAAFLAGSAFVASRIIGAETSDEGAGSEALALKKRILTAQARLRVLERANRGKQARAQRKLLGNLNTQLRAVERREQQQAGKGIAEGSDRGVKKDDGSRGGTKGGYGAENEASTSGNDRHVRRTAKRGFDMETVARLRRRRSRGEVLYSDEEETIEAAEGLIFV